MTEIRNLGTITKLQNDYNTNNQFGIFADCNNLTKVVLPETLITIGAITFIGCTSLTDINLDHVVTFDRYAFGSCTSLSLNDLTLTNAQTIHPGAFANVPLTGTLSCPSLTSLPGEEYSMGAFENTNLTEIADLGSITTIPDVRENAATGCFANNQNLIKVTLPETLTFIGRRAFYNCPKLTTCSIPSSVTTINNSAFANTSLLFDELNLPNLTTLNQNAFYGLKIKKLVLGALTTLPTANLNVQNYGDKSVLEEVVIPEGLTTIPDYSFNGYTSLANINLDNITTIKNYAFGESGLGGILSAPNLTGILQMGAFYKTNIEEVADLGTITLIQNYTNATGGVFAYCTQLKKVTLPSTLEQIGNYTFYECSALATVICEATTPPIISSSTFPSTMTAIYVPDASVDAYKAASGWSNASLVNLIKPMSQYNE